ncbi:MAG: Methyltransferase type 12, partial [Humibacillus sp.]|nr:Methyltransferase type 12 [Humibacillus sp.]
MTEPTPDGVADPGPADPDDADWTWVLTRSCGDCGFDATTVDVEDVPAALR